MKNRDTLITDIREIQLGKVSDATSIDEKFQNETLRPILKLQNELIIAVFRKYCESDKNDFFNFTLNKKLEFIDNKMQKDIKIKDFFKGFIVGMFTLKELETYNQNESSFNKRINSMLIERIKSQLQLLEK